MRRQAEHVLEPRDLLLLVPIEALAQRGQYGFEVSVVVNTRKTKARLAGAELDQACFLEIAQRPEHPLALRVQPRRDGGGIDAIPQPTLFRRLEDVAKELFALA